MEAGKLLVSNSSDIWALTLVMFILYAMGFAMTSRVYAAVIIRLNQNGRGIRFVGKMIGFVAMILVIVIPFLVLAGYDEGFIERFRTDARYFGYFMILFVVSLVPGLAVFRRTILKARTIGKMSR